MPWFIEDGSISGIKLTDGTVTSRQTLFRISSRKICIANQAITTANIAANAITANEIDAHTITADQMQIRQQIIAANITANELYAGSIQANLISAA
jgi:hypothetical protein